MSALPQPRNFFRPAEGDVEICNQAVTEAGSLIMNDQLMAELPCLTDKDIRSHIAYQTDNIQFAQAIPPVVFALDGTQLYQMLLVNFTDEVQPVINETLIANTVPVTSWPLCRVLLMNESRYPWLILVPAQPDLQEINDLRPADQSQLMSELDRVSRALSKLLMPDKINISALGNLVSQLHIHVIARFSGDDAWPKAVWGSHPPLPYKPQML